MTLDPGSGMYGNPDASDRWAKPKATERLTREQSWGEAEFHTIEECADHINFDLGWNAAFALVMSGLEAISEQAHTYGDQYPLGPEGSEITPARFYAIETMALTLKKIKGGDIG